MGRSVSADLISELRHIPDINTDYAIGNMGNSESLYEKIFIMMIRTLPSNLKVMEQHIADNNLDSFCIKIHGQKGTFNQTGCIRLARLAEDLEKAAKQGDRAYCAEHYSAFMEDATSFHERISTVLHEIGAEMDLEKKLDGNISDFYDTLTKVKTAAEGYESVIAAQCLAPLVQHHFSEDADKLVLQALNELEAFHPRKAVPYIVELLRICRTE